MIRVPTGCWRRRAFPGERFTCSWIQSFPRSSVKRACEGRARRSAITVRASHTSDSSDFPSESDTLSLEPHHPLDMSTDSTPGAFLASLPLGHPSHPRSFIKDEGFDLTLTFRQPCPRPRPSWLPVSRHRYLAFCRWHAATSCQHQPIRIAIVTASELPFTRFHPHKALPSVPSRRIEPAYVAWFLGYRDLCRALDFCGAVHDSVEQAYFESAAPLPLVSLTAVAAPLPESDYLVVDGGA